MDKYRNARARLDALQCINVLEESVKSSYLLTMDGYMKSLNYLIDGKEAVEESNIITRYFKHKYFDKKVKQALLADKIASQHGKEALEKFHYLLEQYAQAFTSDELKSMRGY